MSYVLNKIRKDYFTGGVGKRTRAQTDKYLVTLCRLLKCKKNGDSITSSTNKVVEDRKFVSAKKETEAGGKKNSSSSGEEERKRSVKNEVERRKVVVKKEGDAAAAAGKKNRGGFDSKRPASSPGLKFHGQLFFKENDAFNFKDDDVGGSSSAGGGGGGGFGSSRVNVSHCESKKRVFGHGDDDVIEVITIEEVNDEVIEIEEESDDNDDYFPY